jgi:cytochrome P450
LSTSTRKNRQRHTELTHQKLRRRIDVGSKEPDIIGRLIDKKDEFVRSSQTLLAPNNLTDVITQNFSFEMLRANAGGLTIAGSETTATLLNGVTYLLLTHPDNLQKVTDEIRSSFQSTKEITLTSVNGLTYMLACLNEALRLYPPVPIGLPRVTPVGGTAIAGTFIPQDVCRNDGKSHDYRH